MKYGAVPVAGSDLAIARVGFGGARLLGGGEAIASARLIEAALRLGIRHFDTAPTYGLGMSEAILGDVLAGVANVTIATKVAATVAGPPGKLSIKQQVYRRFVRPVLARLPALKRALQRPPASAYEAPGLIQPLTLDVLRRSLDQSEARLGRRADILLLHEPDTLHLGEGVAEQFAEWHSEGRIAAYGGGTGGRLDEGFTFGSIRQEVYSADSAALPHRTAILHGVLRQAPAGQSAGKRLAVALAARPDAAFIISASHPAQLAGLFD